MRGQAGAGSQGGLYRHVGACLLLCVLVASTDACKGAVPACTVRSEAPRVDYNSFGNSLSSLRRASWRVRRAPLGDVVLSAIVRAHLFRAHEWAQSTRSPQPRLVLRPLRRLHLPTVPSHAVPPAVLPPRTTLRRAAAGAPSHRRPQPRGRTRGWRQHRRRPQLASWLAGS